MNIIEVGKPFTGPIPPNDGLHFEIGPDGDMTLLVQFHAPSAEEKAALKNGFRRYALYRHAGNLALACWVFQFPEPVSFVDAPFHAGLYTDGRVRKFLDAEQNGLQVVILDGDMVQILRYVGLQWDAMRAFKEVVQQQLAEAVTRARYNQEIDILYCLSSKELFRFGQVFEHGKDRA